jgi:hypothetical protein
MRTILLSCVLTLGLVACGESPTPPANAPTSTTTSTTTPTTGDTDAKCKGLDAPAGDTDLTSCLASCEKLDDKVPEGTRCIPPRVSCKSNCNTKYKK